MKDTITDSFCGPLLCSELSLILLEWRAKWVVASVGSDDIGYISPQPDSSRRHLPFALASASPTLQP